MSSESDNCDDICIAIPTYKRSEGLKDVLKSVFNQCMFHKNIRILVVDNNSAPLEKENIHFLSKTFKHPIEYIHEPEIGLSNARNAIMKNLKNARYVAFLDDDMVASPVWLKNLIKTSKTFKAGLVFGPTYAVLPDEKDPQNQYMEPFFSRVIDESTDGIISDTLGTGGCLIDLNLCDLPSPAFRPDLNERGGEDDIFFDHLRQTGTRVAWSIDAVSYEIVPAKRANSDYIWKRNFGYGQGPSRICVNRGFQGTFKLIYFMMTGSLQLLVYAPLLVYFKLTQNPISLKYLALTARALGKIFWIDMFSPKLYGKSAT